MLNFGASKPRVKGGARAPGAPPGSAAVVPPHPVEYQSKNPARRATFTYPLHSPETHFKLIFMKIQFALVSD